MTLLVKAETIDIVILCGGKGARLRSVISDRPKSMCEFGGKPFLTILMEYAAAFGFKRFILCTGYMGESIEKYYSACRRSRNIIFSREKKALGTAGAIKKAGRLIKSSSFMVINGDSFCRLKLDKFLEFHLNNNALVSIALTPGKNKNCGKITLDTDRRIIKFEEKGLSDKNTFDSAGVYLMKKEVLPFIKSNNVFSLEYDLFPAIIGKRCFGFKQRTDLIDFGTPDSYRQARQLFNQKRFIPNR